MYVCSMKKSKSPFKQTLLAIAIAIVLTAFVAYGISVFYESPDYEDFCPKLPRAVQTEETCTAEGGLWSPAMRPCPQNERCPEGYCDLHFECRQEYDQVHDQYNRNVFIASMIFGLIILVIGLTLKLESVSTGIMGGGVLTLFIGIIGYWGDLSKYVRLVLLGVLLLILIWIGYKKFGKKA